MCQYKPAQSFQYPWEALGDQSPDYIQLWKLQVRYKKKERKKDHGKKSGTILLGFSFGNFHLG